MEHVGLVSRDLLINGERLIDSLVLERGILSAGDTCRHLEVARYVTASMRRKERKKKKAKKKKVSRGLVPRASFTPSAHLYRCSLSPTTGFAHQCRARDARINYHAISDVLPQMFHYSDWQLNPSCSSPAPN